MTLQFGVPVPHERPPSFQPALILHKMLTVKAVDPTDVSHLEFGAIDVGVPTGMTIEKLASEVARADKPPNTMIGPTPFDIEVKRPAWVLLQLDPRVNWSFLAGSSGISTDRDYTHNAPLQQEQQQQLASPVSARQFGDNFGVTFVPKVGNPTLPGPGAVCPGGCRVLYFGVARRHPPTMQQKFNIFVEFIQGTHRLPTIFDPDVGNNGGSVYPP
jgi:hypothetical protein